MEKFTDEGYPSKTLEVLKNVRINMKVVFLSDINKNGGTKMAR